MTLDNNAALDITVELILLLLLLLSPLLLLLILIPFTTTNTVITITTVNTTNYYHYWSRGSSGSIVSDYGLNDRAIGVRSPAEAKDFCSSLCVQTGSGAHLASCTMGTGGPFPGGKARPGRDADYSSPSSAEVVNE
jgi:hypothetical protein